MSPCHMPGSPNSPAIGWWECDGRERMMKWDPVFHCSTVLNCLMQVEKPLCINQRGGFCYESCVRFNKRVWQIPPKKTEYPDSEGTLLGSAKHECKLLQAEEGIESGSQIENLWQNTWVFTNIFSFIFLPMCKMQFDVQQNAAWRLEISFQVEETPKTVSRVSVKLITLQYLNLARESKYLFLLLSNLDL